MQGESWIEWPPTNEASKAKTDFLKVRWKSFINEKSFFYLTFVHENRRWKIFLHFFLSRYSAQFICWNFTSLRIKANRANMEKEEL